MALPTFPSTTGLSPPFSPSASPMAPGVVPGAVSQSATATPIAHGMVGSIGGIMAMEGQASIDARKAAAETANNQPVIQGLAGHVRQQWTRANEAKRQFVEERMLKSLRQRRGEYDPDVLAEIRKMGGSEIFMMLTSNKCRAAASWIRDVMLGTKDEKPWTVAPTTIPDLPPQVSQSVYNAAVLEAQQFTQATGLPVGQEYIERDRALLYDRVFADAKKQAVERMSRMEDKMEDQLLEGGYQRALGEFIDDIVTFPAAVLKGPVVKKKKYLKWTPSTTKPGDFDATLDEHLCLEWVRVDPFMAYPAPHASDVDDGDFIERHKLTRQALLELKGVEGYNADAIDMVLDAYGKNGLNEWLNIDSQKAAAEGKSTTGVTDNSSGLIDAIQYWGSVQGKLLVEWGLTKDQVPDEQVEYYTEVWLIGTWCIKATVNPDALGRKPYFKASYEEIPGVFWGNSVSDLCRDSQSQCNTAARSIANNMGIASGPQVAYNISRLPTGEDLTQMYPWKIHQYTSDPYGSTAKPVEFFQPQMIAQELIAVYTFFSSLADEHTGVPRYMTGDAQGQGGALRTSSGMSMLMQNAGKAIKQVIANIDVYVTEPLISRLWYYNMKYGTDPALKGDINVVARGANSLIIKETQQQRINEFMQLALTNPLVGQIVGEEAIAAMLRVAAKNLDMDIDQIVPPPEIIRARVAQQSQAAQQEKAQEQQYALALATAPSHEIDIERGPNGEMLGMKIIGKQDHVLMPTGTPPLMPGLTEAGPAGKGTAKPAKTMTASKPTNNFSPRRVH